MAFKITKDLGYGDTIADLYARVVKPIRDYETGIIKYSIYYYPSRAAREKELASTLTPVGGVRLLGTERKRIDIAELTIVNNTPKGIKAAIYNKLKTEDDFSSAEDILEEGEE
jgi:hypothetical protein